MPASDPLKIKQIDVVKNDIEMMKQQITNLQEEIKKLRVSVKAKESIEQDKINESKGWFW
jgi:cell division septum initiation protein DivIVA